MKKELLIGVSGSRGSFSEEAAEVYVEKNSIKNCKIKYLVSVDGVLKQLNAEKIDLGVFPIENSNGGVVEEAVFAMSKYNFKIRKMFEIDVRHNLMAAPGVKTSGIKKICSHQQALRQCRMYLKRVWPGVDLEEYADTAEAAKDLGSGKLGKNTAIIAPVGCASIYGLEILEEGIQDLKFNFTHFIVCVKR